MAAMFGFADVAQTRRGSLRVQLSEGAAARAPDRGLDGSTQSVFAVTRMRGGESRFAPARAALSEARSSAPAEVAAGIDGSILIRPAATMLPLLFTLSSQVPE